MCGSRKHITNTFKPFDACCRVAVYLGRFEARGNRKKLLFPVRRAVVVTPVSMHAGHDSATWQKKENKRFRSDQSNTTQHNTTILKMKIGTDNTGLNPICRKQKGAYWNCRSSSKDWNANCMRKLLVVVMVVCDNRPKKRCVVIAGERDILG